MPKMRATACISVLALLAGCVAGPPIVSQPTGVEGEWIGTDGVAVSSFTGGQFRSTATDTGRLLATGTYRYIDRSVVEVTINSIIRQTTTRANCALVDRRQLNCTGTSGARFSLIRRA